MSIKTKLIAGVGSLTLVAGAMAVAAPAASAADQTLVSCTGTRVVALLNPALGSDDAKYTKASIKRNDAVNSGKYHLSLTGAEDLGPSAQDATTCVVDAGIKTNNAATNSAGGKDNPFDNQTNGQNLTMTGSSPFLPGISGTSAGSNTCNRSDPALDRDYPTAYPLQGKLIFKYNQADAAAKQIQHQFYTRLGTDPADTDVTHITLNGIVIKGPGVGGDVHATFAFGAAFSTKNVNLADCLANPADKNASLAALLITPADGSDVGTIVDPLTITIPA